MNNKKVFGVVAVIVLVLAAVAGFNFGGKEVVVEKLVSGQTQSAHSFFDQGLTQGGSVATTTTAATYTTAARDFVNTPSVILWTPNVNTTVSLSSTSTQEYVPKVGDVANIYLLNASSTANSSITFAAVDAGVDLQFAEATGGDLVLNGLDWAKITLIKQATNKTTVIFDEMTEAD